MEQQLGQIISKFQLGRVVATPGAMEAFDKFPGKAQELLQRHASGDWGEVDAHDKRVNDAALAEGNRLLSAYTLPDGVKLWIITEWDRSATTFLLPDEY